ncbi:MAG: ArnT family glycosyltransferase [Janthinobacterium lividum]
MRSRQPEAAVDAIVARTGAAPVLIILALLLLLPGFFTLPPMDRDEPRFAQASKQMLETSDFVAMRFGAEARNKKPVGIHWLQASAVSIGEALGVPDARHQIWLYRLPSLLGALLAVLLTYWAALPMVTRSFAMLAALFVAATPLLGVEARLATTDAVLLATVVAAMGALGRVYLARDAESRSRIGTPVLFWGAIGVGLLIKGPITPLVVALTALVLSVRERSGRWLGALRPLPGVILCLLFVLPWFVLILIQTKGAFLTDAVGHDLLGKVAGDQESHGAPPGFYLLTVWLTGWPLAPFVLLVAPTIWRQRRAPAVAFLLAWVVPTWLVFEIFHTKLVHYALPIFPGLAILAAYGLEAMAKSSDAIKAPGRVSLWLLFGLLSLVPVVILVLVVGGQGRLWELPVAGTVLAVAAVFVAIALAWHSRATLIDGDVRQAGLVAVLAAVPLYLLVYAYVLTPEIGPALAVSPRLAEAARLGFDGTCVDPLYATVGDREPSLMFATNGRLLMTDPGGAARFIAEGGCRAVFVAQQDVAAFNAALDHTLPVREVSRVAGIGVNGGAKLDIGVYVRQ